MNAKESFLSGLTGFGLNLRLSARGMVRRPVLTFAIVLTLSVGISACATIFGFVDHLLLRDLPYSRPGELVAVWEAKETEPGEPQPASESNFEDWATRKDLFSALGAFSTWMPTLRGEGEPERIVGMSVSAGYFEALGQGPLLGQSIGREQDRPGQERAVVLSYDLWHRRFGADTGVVGRRVTLSEDTYTILGVLPASFRHPRPEYHQKVDVWRPLALAPDPSERGGRYLKVVGRLAPGVSLARARSAMAGLARSLAAEYPVSNSGWGVMVRPLKEEFTGKLRSGLLALSAAAGFVLLIACINVANLLLSRIPSRLHEIVTRVALGAARSQLLSQLLGECLIFGLAGGGLGVLFASWEMNLLRGALPPVAPGIEDVRVDGMVLVFALLVSIVAVALFGLLPAFRTVSSAATLREGAPSVSESRRSSLMMFSLAAVEIAASLVLLVAGGLLLQSFRSLWRIDPGFNAERLLMLELSPRRSKFETSESLAVCLGEIERQVEALPGVASAALISNAPFSTWNTSNYFTPEGWIGSSSTPPPDAEYRLVSADFFEDLRIDLLQGRSFRSAEREGLVNPVIVNQALAVKYWPGESAIGKRLTLDDPAQGHWLSVIGVAKNVLGSGLAKEPKPTIYRPYVQAPQAFMALMVRASGEPGLLVSALRRTINRVDAETAVANVQLVETAIRDSLANERSRALILAFFALAAMILTGVGIYGVLSTGVSQRTREFGIRMALGASGWRILGLAAWTGGRLLLIGVGIGLLLAFGATHLIRRLLFEVSPTDSGIFAACILLQVGVALLATLVPASQAARIQPAVALRRA